MEYYTTNSRQETWMTCVGCGLELNTGEFIIDADDYSLECPSCDGRSFINSDEDEEPFY